MSILKDYLRIFKCNISILRCKAATYWIKRAHECLNNHDIDGFIKYDEYALRCMPDDIRAECAEQLRNFLNETKESINV